MSSCHCIYKKKSFRFHCSIVVLHDFFVLIIIYDKKGLFSFRKLTEKRENALSKII